MNRPLGKGYDTLKEIIAMQRYLSAYYEATERVMKESQLMKIYYIPDLKLRMKDGYPYQKLESKHAEETSSKVNTTMIN